MKDESELFRSLNIHLKNEFLSYTNEESELDCKDQIENIIKFQNAIMGYRENIIPRFNSTIGKDLEGFKVSLKKTHRLINKIDCKDKNALSIYIRNLEKEILQEGQNAIKMASGEGYYDVISRSMKRYEVCIGRGDRGNLTVIDDDIVVGTTKYMSYNLIENDVYSYLKRLRKKRIKVSMSNLIEFFINESNLDESSIRYIKGMIMYPYEELKIIQRYFNNKLEISDEEIIRLIEEERKVSKGVLQDLGGIK